MRTEESGKSSKKIRKDIGNKGTAWTARKEKLGRKDEGPKSFFLLEPCSSDLGPVF
jgi:hypothetical protein